VGSSALGTLQRWAEVMGLRDAVTLLHETLPEESQTDEDLTAIADSAVNAEALQPA
jgi:ferritin-like metal-binding protein YciE